MKYNRVLAQLCLGPNNINKQFKLQKGPSTAFGSQPYNPNKSNGLFALLSGNCFLCWAPNNNQSKSNKVLSLLLVLRT